MCVNGHIAVHQQQRKHLVAAHAEVYGNIDMLSADDVSVTLFHLSTQFV